MKKIKGKKFNISGDSWLNAIETVRIFFSYLSKPWKSLQSVKIYSLSVGHKRATEDDRKVDFIFMYTSVSWPFFYGEKILLLSHISDWWLDVEVAWGWVKNGEWPQYKA